MLTASLAMGKWENHHSTDIKYHTIPNEFFGTGYKEETEELDRY